MTEPLSSEPRTTFDQRGQTIQGGQNNVVETHYHLYNSHSKTKIGDYASDEARSNLLECLRDRVKKVLEKNLHTKDPISLDWTTSLDHIEPRKRIFQDSKEVVSSLPLVQKIITLLDGQYPSILIVGEPGSGKTTTLHEIALILAERAEKDTNSLIPVILDLSTWSKERLAIDKWIISELGDVKREYEIPAKFTEQWIENDQLILLLDGFDEVEREFREECIESINKFRDKRKSMLHIVISSRKHEISNLKKLYLKHEIYIQPLSEQKIYDYLLAVNINDTIAIQELINTDKNYGEFAQNPLMLSVMATAYTNKNELQSFESSDMAKEYLFDNFMEKVFQQSEEYTDIRSSWTFEQMKQWLSWLAKQMSRNEQKKQKEFYLDDIQPTYLPERTVFIYIVFSRLMVSLCTAVIASFFVGGISMVLEFGLIGGVSIGIYNYIKFLNQKRLEAGRPKSSSQLLVSRISNYFYTWLISSLAMSVYFALTLYKSDEALWHLFEPRGIYLGSYVALFFAVVFGGNNHLYNLNTDIVMAEKLSVTRKLFLGAAVVALGVGVSVGLLAIIGYYWDGENLDWFRGAVIQMGGGLLGAFTFGFTVGALFGGIVGATIGVESSLLDRPNQQGDIQLDYRIKRTIKNAELIGLIAILFCTAVLGLRAAGQAKNLREFITGMEYGLALGLLPVLQYGGIALIYHVILRLILFYENKFPWNYAEFLESAARYSYLLKLSGGYQFRHKEFQKYLSAQNVTEEKVQPPYTILLLILIICLSIFAFIIKISPDLPQRWHLLPGLYVSRLNGAYYEVQRGDTIRIEARGTIKVGNFVGTVGVDGITSGLTGNSIEDDYNVKQGLPHGALLCAIVATSEIDDIIKHPDEEMISKIPWEMCTSMPKYTHPLRRLVSYFAGDPHTREIYVERNGCLIFNINDNELENNSGAFRVKVDIDRNLSRSSNNNCSFVNILK